MFHHRLHTLLITTLAALALLAIPMACQPADKARPFAESDAGNTAAPAARIRMIGTIRFFITAPCS